MDEEELKLDMISSSEDKASSIQSFRPSQIMTPSEIDRVLEEISSEFTCFEFNKSDFSMNEHGKECNSLENKETELNNCEIISSLHERFSEEEKSICKTDPFIFDPIHWHILQAAIKGNIKPLIDARGPRNKCKERNAKRRNNSSSKKSTNSKICFSNIALK